MRTVLLVMRADMTAKAAMNQAADPAAFKPVRSLTSPSVSPSMDVSTRSACASALLGSPHVPPVADVCLTECATESEQVLQLPEC